jgi:hypothetical protein
MTESEADYREIAVDRLEPREVEWVLAHDEVHGIAYAFADPIAVMDASDDPDDDRKTYLVRVRRDDLSNAIVEINEWIVDQPKFSDAAADAHRFVTALSREGLSERVDDGTVD